MYGFRSYFIMDNVAPNNQAPIHRGMPVRIVEHEDTATEISEVQGNEVQSTKVLIDGTIYIIRGEHMYNAQGQLVK